MKLLYAEGLGRPFLREALVKYSSTLYQTPIAASRIAVTVSGGNALNIAFQCLLQPGDKVATITSAFPNLLRTPQLQSAELITHALDIVDGKWTLDIDAFIKSVSDAKVGLGLGEAFCAPSNGWFRVCFAQTPSVLDETLARLDHYLKDPACFIL